MRKQWIVTIIIGLLLSACSSEEQQPQQQTPQPTYNGPVVEIGGAEPRYEPYNVGTSQDYSANGKNYKIIKDPQNFSQIGLASWYGQESHGNTTALGENFDPNGLTAAHPTLPIPSYVRVTNTANGRMLVVRVNDRGPYTQERIIDLSQAAAERLNLTNSTKVKVDFINVAPDGTLSGPGTIGTSVAKQSYALPSRPDLGSSSIGTPIQTSESDNSLATSPISNSTLKTPDATLTNSDSSFMSAPSAVPANIIENDKSLATLEDTINTPSGAPELATEANVPAGAYMVQVGTLSNQQNAQAWQQKLSQRFNVPGKVLTHGNLYRVQLGPFSNNQQATQLQQRLSSEAQQQSFVTSTK